MEWNEMSNFFRMYIVYGMKYYETHPGNHQPIDYLHNLFGFMILKVL